MKLPSAIACACLCGLVLTADPLPVSRFVDPERRKKLVAALPEIEKSFEIFKNQRGLPGLVYGVVIDGDLVAVKGLGVRDRKSNDAVTADTVFRIASMTKSFTALAILKLRDEGKLSLEDPVAKWIPEFAHMASPTSDAAAIRVRTLMTHGAGFPEDNPWGDRQLGVGDATLARWLKLGLPFSTSPDTAFEYSNYGFALLGRIVAKASRKPYREYVESQILAPLGMKSTTLEPAAVPENRRAIGYRKTGDEYSEEPSLPHGTFGAMGGMLTSANDLARYVAFHLSAWPPRDGDDRGPVRRSSVREMQRLQRSSVFRVNRDSASSTLRVVSGGYGYGLSVTRDCRFSHIVGHGGGLPGFGSYMLWLPEYGVGVFAMANLTYAGPFGTLDQSLDALRKTGALKSREQPPSPVLITTRDAILRLWQNWSGDELKAIAADNLLLDSSAEARRKEVEKLKEQVGACRADGAPQSENWLRATFRMNCERGGVDVSFTLAPTQPPKLQLLRFMPARASTPAADGFCQIQ